MTLGFKYDRSSIYKLVQFLAKLVHCNWKNNPSLEFKVKKIFAVLFYVHFFIVYFKISNRISWSTTTDREQTDRWQRRLAEKNEPKYIFTIPRGILPKPSLCDEIAATKSL